MSSIRIEGGYKLSGEIKVEGAKNSAVALIPPEFCSCVQK